MARLRRSDSSGPGSRGDAGGEGSVTAARWKAVTDRETLERIRSLAVPPAWTEVWICPWPNGHIQAVGTDAAGRRQYRYHDQWRMDQDREKFDRTVDFAAALPRLRARVERDLTRDGLGGHGYWRRSSVCSMSDFSASAARSTRTSTRPSGWPTSARSTCASATVRWSSTTRPRAPWSEWSRYETPGREVVAALHRRRPGGPPLSPPPPAGAGSRYTHTT